MAGLSRDLSSSSRGLAQADATGLASPFQRLEVDLSKDELKETSYEIFAAACKAASGIGAFGRSKTGLSYVSQASQKNFAANASSSIKKALGLRSKKGVDKEQIGAAAKSKKQQSTFDIVRIQMGISDQTDTRIRRALSRTAAGQVGKNVDMMLVPLELLQQIRLADFADVKEYQLWQKRQLKVLEAGLLLHPAVKLDQSNTAAQRMKQILRSCTEKPLETGKNSESMQALRSAATSLAGRSDDAKVQEVCHWADGLPLNLYFYQALLASCFDRAEETNLIDEIDDVIDLFKKTWGILGINQALHNLCLMWVLFRQFAATGQNELDLLRAADTQMAEVAKDAKETKDPQYILVLSSVLTSIQTWSEKRLFSYHDTFPEGAKGLMENLIPVALNAARIIHEDISHEFRRRRKEEVDVASSRIDLYVRSSLRTAFAQMMEQGDSRRKSFSKRGSVPGLVTLARDATDLIGRERKRFSPILKRWHPFAGSLAAATLHSCFGSELKQYLSGINVLTPEAVEVLQQADQLEKELVQIAVEDAVDSDDGGKAVIREMVPYEAQSAILDLAKNWIQEKLGLLREWVDRNLKQEDWNPEAIKEHYAPSIVEVFRIIEETLDAFFELPVAELSTILQDFILGLDKVLHRYVAGTKAGCGSKKDLVPSFPPLTRCKDPKLHGSFSGLWKKKERTVNRSKTGDTSSRNAGSDSARICVRINTLHYIQTELDVLEKRLSNGWQKDIGPPSKTSKTSKAPPPQPNGVHLRFEQTRTGIQEGIQSLYEVAVYHVIFIDLRTQFWEGLYCGSVAHARIGQVLQPLEGQLVLIAGTVNERLRNRIIGALMRACFEALLMVLLAGGPSRSFSITDAEMLDEDFTLLKDLFKADGEGLPSGAVEKAAILVTQVLPLFAISTEDIIENYKQCLSEKHGLSSSKTRLPLPEFTGQWSPTDANTLLRILCYRCDSAASKFLKKAYNLPKRS